MKLIPDPTGRFKERPYFDAAELDVDCESRVSKFLRSIHGKVEFPIATDDLTKLIEQHVDDFDSFADLTTLYGEGVEGVTEFRPGKKPIVRIHQDLTGDDARENRLRTTLTHELGHVIYHAWLFDLRDAPSLFPKPRSNDVQVCKRETILNAPQVDWMEWQAGHVCGAMLMPSSRVRRLAKEVAASNPPPELEAIGPDSAYGRALIRAVSTQFQVSSDAAEVRSHRLGLLSRMDRSLTF